MDELDYQDYRVAAPFRRAPSDDHEFGATGLDVAPSNDHMLDAAEVATPSTRSSEPAGSELLGRSLVRVDTNYEPMSKRPRIASLHNASSHGPGPSTHARLAGSRAAESRHRRSAA